MWLRFINVKSLKHFEIAFWESVKVIKMIKISTPEERLSYGGWKRVQVVQSSLYNIQILSQEIHLRRKCSCKNSLLLMDMEIIWTRPQWKKFWQVWRPPMKKAVQALARTMEMTVIWVGCKPRKMFLIFWFWWHFFPNFRF